MMDLPAPLQTRRLGFTLLEMVATVLIGAFIVLMIAGVLRNSMFAWETVQFRVGENYNRRMVLDLIKRQTSSLFLRTEAEQLSSGSRSRGPRRTGGNTNNQPRRDPNANPQIAGPQPPTGFQLPEGSYFFLGTPQELNFLSTVSFLSDFPGQVAVRYFVVQGAGEEGADLMSLPSSRTLDPRGDANLIETFESGNTLLDYPPPLEGDLYLYVEETNLFLTQSEQSIAAYNGTEEGADPQQPTIISAEARDRNKPNSGEEAAGPAQAVGTSTMALIGPLRAFSLRYRFPLNRGVQEEDTEEDWAEAWDLESEGRYPSAVEFILFYEKPGITDDIPTEELPGIRMVLPIYDTNNLMRGGNNAPF
ncbi:PulJ/GspJ family protein [Acanthopleuribacter pedis]|uniref:Prepilin-type N-terminal cleavage/methylation domain-containing protein n=1 Tax=Acanthopleuribacter pedis TaxID=442870 RepID=A0A8J7QDF2_9BACT|nr:hypothetical protein [Acanthopleuribacter pedis]MBO1319046.1 hypothetical protein [Acanthopleuribacter pedis]